MKYYMRFSPGITITNVFFYLLASLLTITFFVFINSTQGFVLSQILAIPINSLGDNSGSLVFYDELLSIIMVCLWGILSDKIGNRAVYFLGFSFLTIGLALFTYATNLYPQLLIFRLLFAMGGSACSCMMVALLSEYASQKDRGKLAGLVGISSGLGALLALFAFLPMVTTISGGGVAGLKTTYLIMAAICFVFGIIHYFASKCSNDKSNSPNENSESQDPILPLPILEQSIQDEESVPIIYSPKNTIYKIITDAFKASKNSKILLGYLASFLARGDSIILTVFIPLWVYKYYIEQDICSASQPEEPDIKSKCHVAFITASILSGTAQSFALLGAPLFGWLNDKLYRPACILISGLLGIIGYFGMFLATNPTSSLIYLFVCLAGLGEMGMVVGSLSLCTTASIPMHSRGTVAGLSSFFGAAGILVTTKLGGYLFDNWRSGAPFFIVAVGHAVCASVALIVVGVDLRNKSKCVSVENRSIFRYLSELQKEECNQ